VLVSGWGIANVSLAFEILPCYSVRLATQYSFPYSQRTKIYVSNPVLSDCVAIRSGDAMQNSALSSWLNCSSRTYRDSQKPVYTPSGLI